MSLTRPSDHELQAVSRVSPKKRPVGRLIGLIASAFKVLILGFGAGL